MWGWVVEYERMSRDKGRAGRVWCGRLAWVFDFSVFRSFTFQRQIKYLPK